MLEPDRRIFTREAPPGTAFGLVFFGAGLCAVVAAVAGMGRSENAAVGLVVGLVFTTIGTLMAFGRTGLIADRRERSLGQWRGLIGWPWHVTPLPWPGEGVVRVSRVERRRGKTRWTCFAVELDAGDTPLVLGEPRRAGPARLLAEAAARFFELPMRDCLGDTPLDRRPEHLDESVRARARRLGETHPRPEPPLTTALAVEISALEAIVAIPPVGWTQRTIGAVIGPGLVGLCVALLLTVPVLAAGAGEDPERPGDPAATAERAVALRFGLAFIGAFIVAIPLLPALWRALRIATRAERVTISRDLLRVERSERAGRRTVIEMDAEEIEWVDLADLEPKSAFERMRGERAVIVRCDEGAVELGAGLTEPEREFLRDCLRHYLAKA